MFGPPARAYVYRIYGLHWCFNMVAERGSAVLIRAIAPTAGVETMCARRRTIVTKALCAGPGRLCEALAINRTLDGRSLAEAPFSLTPPARRRPVIASTRIGVREETPAKLRFCRSESPFLSRSP